MTRPTCPATRLMLPVVLAAMAGWSIPTIRADTVFNALVNTPNGPAHGLFQMSNGTVTTVNTNLPTNQFPSLSHDGRFITIASPDPAQPFQPATDLFIFDRANGVRSRIVNYTAETQPDGSIVTPHAQFSALSPSNQLIALNTLLMVTTNQAGSSSFATLTVHRASDGFQLSIAEMGIGNQLDFFRAEFVGISWAPNGSVFATPAYVNTPTLMGNLQASVGIVLFGFDPGTGQWQRVGQITQPRIFDNVLPAVIETHILPRFSPNGQRLAFFEITWFDALLQNPASARLIAINTDGSNPQVLATFNPGFYPLGLAWSTDGSDVIYSIAPQTQTGGGFAPFGEPSGAVIRKVNSTNPVAIESLPGINSGFFPNSPMITRNGGDGGVIDLSRVPLRIQQQSGGGLLLSAAGLDPGETYRLESSINLLDFGGVQDFTGQQIMNGIPVTADGPRRFWRFRRLP